MPSHLINIHPDCFSCYCVYCIRLTISFSLLRIILFGPQNMFFRKLAPLFEGSQMGGLLSRDDNKNLV